MKTVFLTRVTLLSVLVLCASCMDPGIPVSPSLTEVMMYAPSLENNLLHDSPDRHVLIYLPPSYALQPDRRYPVIYLLHGFMLTNSTWVNNHFLRIDHIMNELIGNRQVGEMIIVMPNARNLYGGSFYTNSIVTGNWEDFIVKDLVNFMDSHYRTRPEVTSRAIVGHSMGGFGALKIAMQHPDVFGVVYGVSACCQGMQKDITDENPNWFDTLAIEDLDALIDVSFYSRVQVALASAFSPNPENHPLLVDFPYAVKDNQLVPAEPAYSKWLSQMPLTDLDRYHNNLLALKAIGFEVGTNDQFSHILPTNRALDAELTRRGIPHRFDEHQGSHSNQIPGRIKTIILPFLSEQLGAQ